MASTVSFSRKHSTLNDIEAYYVDSADALNFYFDPSGISDHFDIRFHGYSRIMIDHELKLRKEALDRMCSLEILASLEARFRLDYLVRCQKKRKDDLSKNLRDIYKKFENKASLKDDILYTWKMVFNEHKTRLDELGKALDYRNWLAHGRYWFPKKSPHIARYDYLSIYALAADITSNMELFED
jgi:hypothetical protein